ncbi:MAG TPA: C45 family peptidase [Candidatus Limnocylindrales bacterium]|nr:C45 family peptidase [Candidatus Limnocylindrales bacterium]
MTLQPFVFRALAEDVPGPVWQGVFEELWPGYRSWFLREGDSARASYADGVRMLEIHMPELLPLYATLCELAGGSDVAARMLSMVDPPPFLAACSQGAWTRGSPMLVRNYDYRPDRLEGIVWATRWTGRRVIGMSDMLWGLLDGMNEDGLAISLTFGGRPVLGRGFGIPLVVRYLLETCGTVAQAIARLSRLPVNLAHNLTMLDASGEFMTVYLAPDRDPVFTPVAVATNHQHVVDWPEYTAATRSHEREGLIAALLADPAVGPDSFVAAFLQPPLRDSAGMGHFGTLYTAVFRPAEGRVEYRWPDFAWHSSFQAFEPGSHTELLAGPAPEG